MNTMHRRPVSALTDRGKKVWGSDSQQGLKDSDSDTSPTHRSARVGNPTPRPEPCDARSTHGAASALIGPTRPAPTSQDSTRTHSRALYSPHKAAQVNHAPTEVVARLLQSLPRTGWAHPELRLWAARPVNPERVGRACAAAWPLLLGRRAAACLSVAPPVHSLGGRNLLDLALARRSRWATIRPSPPGRHQGRHCAHSPWPVGWLQRSGPPYRAIVGPEQTRRPGAPRVLQSRQLPPGRQIASLHSRDRVLVPRAATW